MGRKIVMTYYLFEFLTILPTSLMFVTYVIFLRENNLSFSQVGLVNGMFMLGIVIFEIPTGIVADVFGRKFSILVGLGFQSLSMLVYYFGVGMWAFIFAELGLAFGACFMSGAIDAWAKDSLDNVEAKYSLGGIFSLNFMISRIATIIGGAIGGFFFLDNLRALWLISGVILFMLIPLFYYLLHEDYYVQKQFFWSKAWVEMLRIGRESIQFGWQVLPVRNLMFTASIYLIACQALNMQWSLYIKDEFSDSWLGYFWVIVSLMILLGNWIADRLMKKNFSYGTILRFSLLFSGLSLIFGVVTMNKIFVLLGFLLSEVGRGAFNAPKQGYLHSIIPGDKRASIASFSSMVEHLGAGFGWVMSCVLANYLSVEALWFISGIIFLFAYWQSFKLER